jgi:hypothetical protein
MANQQSTLLTGEEIKSEKLVTDGADKFYRASTYDLSVGDIIPAGGELWTESKYLVPPGGMVRVISKESLKLSDEVTGHVLLKNELCTKGVLAINIGVVDPAFEGPLSSTLINFGREPWPLEKGTAFLRVSFLRCSKSANLKPVKYDRDKYLARAVQEVLAYSAPTFLNMDTMTTKAAEKAFASFKEGLILWATVVAVLLALLAIFAPLGASLVDRHLTTEEQREDQMEQTVERKVEDRYEARLEALTAEVQQLQQTTPKPNSANGPTGKQ